MPPPERRPQPFQRSLPALSSRGRSGLGLFPISRHQNLAIGVRQLAKGLDRRALQIVTNEVFLGGLIYFKSMERTFADVI